MTYLCCSFSNLQSKYWNAENPSNKVLIVYCGGWKYGDIGEVWDIRQLTSGKRGDHMRSNYSGEVGLPLSASSCVFIILLATIALTYIGVTRGTKTSKHLEVILTLRLSCSSKSQYPQIPQYFTKCQLQFTFSEILKVHQSTKGQKKHNTYRFCR